MPICQKIEYQTQRISVNFTNDCGGATRVMYYRKLSKQIFWHIDQQNETATLICYLLSGCRQPTTLWPKAPNIAIKNIFLCKIICNNYFIVKCILWYWLQLSDPFFNSKNSVSPILISKNFGQKIDFRPLKMRSIFLKERKSNCSN